MSMVTGDQDSEQRPEQHVVEIAPVECSCKWSITDTGNMFYSRIAKRDPACKVHPPEWFPE